MQEPIYCVRSVDDITGEAHTVGATLGLRNIAEAERYVKQLEAMKDQEGLTGFHYEVEDYSYLLNANR